MKKLFLYVFLGLMWCNTGFAECIKGDCNNGYGTQTWSDGDKYVGEYKDGKRHGQGTYTWSDGEKHVGEYENGKAHGQGTKTYPAGHYEVLKNHGIVYFDKYVGEWVNNERHGQGTITLADGTEHVTEWKNDKFEKVSSEKSELKSEEQVKDEEQSESKDETVTYANGDKYVGELQDGQRHGQGTMTYANGDEYVGTWSNDQQYARHGKVGTMTYANGDKYVGEFMIDKPYGKGTITYANGDKYVGELRHGHRDEGTMTYANGDKFEGKWDSDDKRSGDGTMTLADGTVYEYYWNDDKPMLSLGLYDIPLIDFSINCRTVNYTSTTTEWFWNRDSMTVKQFTKYGKNFIKALKDAGYSKSQIEQVIEEGREGLTSTIVDWNRSEISYRSRLDDGLYKFDGVEFKMPNGSKYQEKCRLIEFKEQEQKTKKKKPIKRDKELDNLKKEADVMSRNAAACHINSTGNTRKLLGGHINYLYSLVQNSKLPGYDNEQMYRQIISASDTILKLGKCN